MADEPMDEDDSFYRPVPCSTPINRPFMSQAPRANADSDPDSDDSFETFAPTQSTAGSSGSAPSGESKSSMPAPVPVRPILNPSRQSTNPSTQKGTFRPSIPSISTFSQQTTQKIGGPSGATQKFIRPAIPFQTQTQSSTMMTPNKIGEHAAVKNTRETEMTQKTSSGIPATPSSPNSLLRHRSANSGLRHSSTPLLKTASMMFARKTPPEVRPSTPSGEIKMLRDQLDYEKQKNIKLQAEFQNDTQKHVLQHKKEISERDEQIKEQEKEIEMLRTSSACRKAVSSTVSKPEKTVNIVHPTIPSNSEVKKVYPKIPAEAGNLRRTPRRTGHLQLKQLSAFRHALKEEDEDTFQLDDSFEPAATSTPKTTLTSRFAVRRPLDLGSEWLDAANGAPTPKRVHVFQPERTKRNREQLDEELLAIWSKMECAEVADQLFVEKKKKEEAPYEDHMEIESEENEWIENYLSQQIKSIEFRKTTEKLVNPKARTKKQKPDQKPVVKNSCDRCRIDKRMTEEEVAGNEKDWEVVEDQRVDRARRTAEELRSLQYSEFLQALSRKGIEELDVAGDWKQRTEEKYEQQMKAVRKRPLDEIREEKKEKWRNEMMRILRENGELEAVLDFPETERHEDCMWTSDSDDEDWMFPAPYDVDAKKLCSDCADRQRRMRRISKREKNKQKLKIECLHEYGVEQRELLRNMSVLTKSKMEAADNELNQHVDDMMASRLFDDEDEDEDMF